MYAYAPPFPISYRWLFQPLSSLSASDWQAAISNLSPKDLQSYYVMIPMELRNTFFRRVNASRWSTWAAIATATVVSSAVALYYAAPWGAFDDLGFMTGDDDHHFMITTHDEDNAAYESDDEPVDEDLLDGFRWGDKRRNSMFLLVSSDPKSDLSRRPIHLDFTEHMPRLARIELMPQIDLSKVNAQLEANSLKHPVSLQVPPAIMFTDPFEKEDGFQKKRNFAQISPGFSPGTCSPVGRSMSCSEVEQIPSILKRDSLALSQPKPKRALLSSDMKHDMVQRARSPLSQMHTSMDEGPVLTESPESSTELDPNEIPKDTSAPRSRRSIVITEPDWAPFADTNTRARTRSIIASLKEPRANSDSDALGAAFGNNDEVNSLLAPAVSEDGELWFERFMHSTAATSKRMDWRRRNSANLAELFDKLEQLRKSRDGEGMKQITAEKTTNSI
ncbi:hypothetical protein MCUN1_002202 [Malassezia cuniculi]|uniref:Uncharacterized protein n=1 Tax=Malassezia cuniculi TaxID=948313 RepID=A0AAF0EZA5_9BASI|nr:hypothetical protein MCUN1_002202 [Malassezia cuniculi]